MGFVLCCFLGGGVALLCFVSFFTCSLLLDCLFVLCVHSNVQCVCVFVYSFVLGITLYFL